MRAQAVLRPHPQGRQTKLRNIFQRITQAQHQAAHRQLTCGLVCARSAAIIALTLFLPANAYAQDQSTLYKDVKGWTINQYAQSESSPDPSCSAVFIQNLYNGLRIERFTQGYLFGINGLSRENQGRRYPLKFWFEGDRTQELSGEASFVKDAAYPLDDWLSYFHPINQQPSPVKAIGDSNIMSFAFPMPGNRTGNQEVTVTYQLNDSAAALLALDECYAIANSPLASRSQS